jgi:hypothetical protein
MIVCDFLIIPVKQPTSNETQLEVTESVLVSHIPGVVKGLPVAFGLHSDTAIDRDVELSWEIVGAGGFVGDFGGPIHLHLSAGEVMKTTFPIPDFEVPKEGNYTIVLYGDNDRLKDFEFEIRLPRE